MATKKKSSKKFLKLDWLFSMTKPSHYKDKKKAEGDKSTEWKFHGCQLYKLMNKKKIVNIKNFRQEWI